MRAGGHALSLLSVPLNVHALHALEQEPTPLIHLRRAVGSAPQTTLRKHLRNLTEIGVVERNQEDGFPGALRYQLGRPGRELLAVSESVQSWLAASPDEPLTIGSAASKSAIKALVEAWSSSIVRALAARPLSLTELNHLISSLNYPSLERRLGAMRLVGQVESRVGDGRGRPYLVTDWLRRAVGPLTIAARWEGRYVPDRAAPISRIDAEAAFLLTVPMLRVAEGLSGQCRLAIEVSSRTGPPRPAGVIVGVEDGRVVSCSSRLEGDAAAWVSGPATAWFSAVIEHDTAPLEIGGDCELATALVENLHGVLFGTAVRSREAHP